jgi:hypothetical protein
MNYLLILIISCKSSVDTAEKMLESEEFSLNKEEYVSCEFSDDHQEAVITIDILDESRKIKDIYATISDEKRQSEFLIKSRKRVVKDKIYWYGEARLFGRECTDFSDTSLVITL